MPPGRLRGAGRGAGLRSGGDALDSESRGEGSRGARRSRTAGAGEGEGGEPTPDAEASTRPPDDAPAENSIEGEPLRLATSGPAECRACS